jgi:hypothetical protein
LEIDRAAFQTASFWAVGAGAASVGGMSYLGRRWPLAFRLPAVTVTGLFAFGAANLYATKSAIEGLA